MNSDRPAKILVIDDDHDVLYTARLVLRGLFEIVDTLDSPVLILECLKKSSYAAILLDMNFTRGSTSGSEGLEWLRKILNADPGAHVVMTTAYGEINLAVQAMKLGAFDFIIKPWNKERLVISLKNVIHPTVENGNDGRARKFSGGLTGRLKHQDIVSRSSVMREIGETIRTVAPTNANVLILGENGTGKELIARALHNESHRRVDSFVHVDLGAIPETLFESELFGHARGAFTDAREEREGRFEAASGGTLFLDEIGNLTLPLQAKILTAIQNREVMRIGNNKPVPVDIRLISATNMPLYQMAESFDFRQDLLYRINTIEIVVPPLRDRKEDIRPIANYYLDLYSEDYNKAGITFRDDTLCKLEEYSWPGNIRELAHSIERAVILCKGKILRPEDFTLYFRNAPVQKKDEPLIKIDDYEKAAINSALGRHNGNLSRAAEELGMARSTLYRKIANLGIDARY
ncbi:MAG: sigma-54 dependent transcriptional regulator [Bacteroidota bacterium]|nr:sigma-54 dependent transcriptional regulator [Bacteroidota bacterium]